MKKLFILALIALMASISLAANTQKQIRFVDENGDVRTDITSVTVRDTGTTTGSTLTTTEVGGTSITNPMTTTSTNTGLDAGNGIIIFCSAASTYDIKMTIGGNGINLYSIPATKKSIMIPFRYGPVVFNDDEKLYFGDGKDVSISQSAAGLLTFGQTVAGTGSVAVGVDDAGLDVTLYGDTTLVNMLWDTSENVLSFTGDPCMLEFGGAVVDANETTISVVEPTKSNIVTLPDDTGYLAYMAEAGTANFGPTGTIPLTDAVVLYTSTGADAITLPDGTSPGQILTIVLVAQGGGAATLTPTSVTGCGWATMVFTNVGESATFMYIDSTIGWTCLGTFGVSTQPLITQ